MSRLLVTLGLAAAALAGIAAVPLEASAQAYPNRPVRFVVPFPPGGGADMTARTISPRMSEALGQPIVIENRAGAGGHVATEYVSKAAPDGYTILLTNNGIAIQPHLSKVTWDPIKDFAPVSVVNTYPLVVAVHPSVPANTIAELVALAKAQPGKLTYGSSGNGGPVHMGAELFKARAGVDILHVPYKGNAPMTIAVIAGEVNMVFDSLTGPLQNIRAGKLRALATTGTARSAVLPDTPTVAEALYPGFEYRPWNGVVAPAETPPEVVNRLNAVIVQALAAPEVKEKYGSLGYDATATTPQEMAALIAADLVKFEKIVKDAKIKAD
jgi:tripartite-type tricarboxylate transporter receptor subunit TctC